MLVATVGVAVLLLGPLSRPAAAAPPVEITSFRLSPACVEPGGTLGVRFGVRNTTFRFQRTWFQVVVTYNLVFEFETPGAGPVPLPPRLGFTVDEELELPRLIPIGVYDVTVGIGPNQADPTGWDTASDRITVLPICIASGRPETAA